MAKTPGSPPETTATRLPRRARSRANSARSDSTLLSEPCRTWPGLTGTRSRYVVYPTSTSASARARRVCGVSHSGPAGPVPTTTTSPGPDGTLPGLPIRLGTTATAKYGTLPGSVSARTPVRSPSIVARST